RRLIAAWPINITRTRSRLILKLKRNSKKPPRLTRCFRMRNSGSATIDSVTRVFRAAPRARLGARRDLAVSRISWATCSDSAMCLARGRPGGRRSAAQRGADLRYDLEITLEQ